MLKRTLFFGNPYHISVRNKQLVAKSRETQQEQTVPVEDIGFIVFDNDQITFTQGVIEHLNSNNVALVFCGSDHMPRSMMLNLDGHHLQSEYFTAQICAAEPLKKLLWKQTVVAKIQNQAKLLKKLDRRNRKLDEYARNVKSGDTTNREAVAARVYWSSLFTSFKREPRSGTVTNCLLNYGYAVLRAGVARALTGSGLLPTLGIHHSNRYNAFCLADDIMEPYRPFVDEIVYNITNDYPDENELTRDMKAELLEVLSQDTLFAKTKRPLMVGLSQTTASLGRCFRKEEKQISYPVLI